MSDNCCERREWRREPDARRATGHRLQLLPDLARFLSAATTPSTSCRKEAAVRERLIGQ